MLRSRDERRAETRDERCDDERCHDERRGQSCYKRPVKGRDQKRDQLRDNT